MSSKGNTSNNEGGEVTTTMLQAMQQQFERINVVFNEMRDRSCMYFVCILLVDLKNLAN